MSESPVDFVTASVETRDRKGNKIESLIYQNRYISDNEEIICDYFMNKKRPVTVWNKLYDLSFLLNHNIKCIHAFMHEDNLFTFQVILKARSCKYVSDITYYFYDTPDSLNKVTNNNQISPKYALQYIDSIAYKREHIQDYIDKRARECVYRYIIFQTIYYVTLIKKSVILSHKEKKEYIKQLVIFPFDVSEIRKLDNKFFFYIMYLIYSTPFTSTLFRLIRYLSFIFSK
jgi:hypothetical protein